MKYLLCILFLIMSVFIVSCEQSTTEGCILEIKRTYRGSKVVVAPEYDLVFIVVERNGTIRWVENTDAGSNKITKDIVLIPSTDNEFDEF